MLAAPAATMTPARSSERLPLSQDAVAFGPGAVPFYGSASSYVDGLPRGWSESSDTTSTFVDMFKWARIVHAEGACALPGVSIKFDRFIPAMWKAVRLGFVQAQHAEFVHLGLRWGFEVGLHPDRVIGHRFFKNYESSTSEAARARVTEATEVRVAAGKTMHLGKVLPDTLSILKQVFPAAYIFPMGATAKPLEPTKLRPTDDHTRTGLNAACDMAGPRTLSYSLDVQGHSVLRFEKASSMSMYWISLRSSSVRVPSNEFHQRPTKSWTCDAVLSLMTLKVTPTTSSAQPWNLTTRRVTALAKGPVPQRSST
jgi:hypothetical protein